MKKRHIGRVSVSADFIGHIGLYTIGYILGISINEMLMRKWDDTKNVTSYVPLSSILIYQKLINLRLEKLMCEKLWKWKIFMHFLTLFYVSVLNRYRPIMQLSYRYRHRYRPIWKSDISVVIGIGRYEKMLIGRPLKKCINYECKTIYEYSVEFLNEALRSPNHKTCFNFALKCQ